MTPNAIRRHLDKVLGSPAFGRNERLSRFLRFAVDLHLEGLDHQLKESVIGTEIFGRKPGYNPKSDGVVRNEARRLRALPNRCNLRPAWRATSTWRTPVAAASLPSEKITSLAINICADFK